MQFKPNEAAERLVAIPIGLLEASGRPKITYCSRLDADELTRILRRCRAPEPWQNPSACTGIGTIAMRTKPHPAAIRVQAAVEELKRAIVEFHDAEQYYQEIGNNDIKKLYNGEIVVNEFPQQVSSRVRQLSKQLNKCADILLPLPKFTAWHLSALILFELYRAIVGICSPSANGPAVQYVHLVFARLGLGERTEEAIEKALRRFGDVYRADPSLPLKILGVWK